MSAQVTTTAGEPFTSREHEYLAALIWKRFGWDDDSAAAAWRRLLGNGCPTPVFVAMAQAGAADVRRQPTAWATHPPTHPALRGTAPAVPVCDCGATGCMTCDDAFHDDTDKETEP